MENKIYLMRHGLTESNKNKVYAGWNDEPLCEEGIAQLRKIGEKLKYLGIEKIFCSPIRRAFHTAEIINNYLNKPIVKEERLKEMKMGPWEGLSEDDVANKYPKEWYVWNTNPSKLDLPDRETLKNIQYRALNVIKDLSYYSNCSRILAITHVAIIRVLMIYYNKIQIDNYRRISIPNSSVYLFDNQSPSKNLYRIL